MRAAGDHGTVSKHRGHLPHRSVGGLISGASLSLPVALRFFALTIATLALMAGSGSAVADSTLQVLYSFANMRGYDPPGGLVADAAGNFYGTVSFGGPDGGGVAFELSPPVDGKGRWTETVLHAFAGGLYNIGLPISRLLRDGAGNLYGVAEFGGQSASGAVYELSPPQAGKTAWAMKILHFFNGQDGSDPRGGLIMDESGNLYGITNGGGKGQGPDCNGCGVVFELSPPAQSRKRWIRTVLHDFRQSDGQSPSCALVRDSAGNLYGVTFRGGAHDDGVVYELSPPTGGQKTWALTVLHSFNGRDGLYPLALIADGEGNLYGTTYSGGPHACSFTNCGEIYELSSPAGGQDRWALTVLRGLNGKRGDETAGPPESLVMDGAGNLYVTDNEGGRGDCSPDSDDGCGLIFELSPQAGKRIWSEKVLHSFGPDHIHFPIGSLSMDGAGGFYGVTSGGGKFDDGGVFKFTP